MTALWYLEKVHETELLQAVWILNGYAKGMGRFTASFDRIANYLALSPHTPWFRGYWGSLV